MNRPLAVLVLTTALAPVGAPADEPVVDDFAYAMQLDTVGDVGLYRIGLPLDVYRVAVRPDLGDLRVFNAAGEVVPHALEPGRREAAVRLPSRTLTLFPLRGDPRAALDAVRVTIRTGEGDVDVAAGGTPALASGPITGYLADARDIDARIDGLTVGWTADTGDFAARVDVEAGVDLDSFRSIRQGAPVFNLGNRGERFVQARIEFPSTRARFWRLTVKGENATAVTLDRVEVHAGEDRDVTAPEVQAVPGLRDRKNPRRFTFDLGAVLPVATVNLALPEPNTVAKARLAYRRTADEEWRSAGRADFYRLATASGEVLNEAFGVGGEPVRYWQVEVDPAGGGLGSGVPELRASWYPHQLLFAARGAGPFTLAFGSATVLPAGLLPADLVPGPGRRPGSEPHLLLSEMLHSLREAGGESRLVRPPLSVEWQTVVLWAALLLGVGALGVMAYRLVGEMGKGRGD